MEPILDNNRNNRRSDNNVNELAYMIKAKEIKLPITWFDDWRLKFKVVGISRRSHSIRVGKIRRGNMGRFLTAWSLIGDDAEQSEFYSHFSNN